ncbi:hypothetical protein HCA78_02380 [Listeria booriae]|uniref:Lipoprotein n=1 Tax=Listeria booriae TaxID=1552123 RepID=A0A842CPA1_9LIST|nr:hypothetical protein [Listeria booriae]MBC2002599.1 hypothetical protein [Listeria booriae]
MNLTKMGTCLITIFLLFGCTPSQEIADTGGNNTVTNQTSSNKELTVEWAPLYTSGSTPEININSDENQYALNSIKILMLSDVSSAGKVTLTTNGGGYISDGQNKQEGSFFLLTLLTNRTDKKITNIHYEIRVILNSSGEILGESAFDIPSEIYGEYIEPNKGYVALLPFDDKPMKAVGVSYKSDEITVYQEITYDTVEE